MSLTSRLLAATLALALPLLSSCAGAPATTTSAPSAAAPITVRMGIQPWIGYGQWHVAQAKDMLKAKGINLELTELKTDADQSAAFASGRIDVDNIATHTALLLKSQGVGLKIVMIEDVSTTADAIMARGDIKSMADLKGKRVAYEQGATSDLLLNTALKSAGLTLKDITPVPMPAADAGAALIGKKVDAAVTYEPYITAAMKDDKTVKKVYDAGKHPGLISDVLVASDDFAAKHPDVVRTLVEVWGQAVEAYKADPKGARAIIAKAVGEEPSALTTAFDGVQYYGKTENAEQLPTFATAVLPTVAEAAKQAEILTDTVDLNAVVDPQFVK